MEASVNCFKTLKGKVLHMLESVIVEVAQMERYNIDLYKQVIAFDKYCFL